MTDEELVDIIARASMKATIDFAERSGRSVPAELRLPWELIPNIQKKFAREQAEETIRILRESGYEISITKGVDAADKLG